MTVARSVARAVASPVARAIGAGIGGGGYDVDADAYFAAVEGAGGSFDLSGINATYTESYVKAAHDTLFKALKSASVWDKIDELYLLVGKTFDGITVKAKGTGSLTNNGPFVSGDYVAAGSSAGLTGNGSTKYIGTGYTITGAGIADLHLMAAWDNSLSCGLRSGTSIVQMLSTGGLHYHPGNPGRINHPIPYPTSGITIGTSGVGPRTELYHNGTSTVSGTVVTTTGTPNPFALFQHGNGSTFEAGPILASSIGKELADTDAENLTTCVETFMDSLGTGVIP